MWLEIISILYLCYAIWFWFFVNRFFKSYSFLTKKEARESVRFPAFTRKDYSSWNKLKFYLGGVFLLPIRVITMSLSLFFCYVNLKILSICFWINDYTKPLNPKFVKLAAKILGFHCKLISMTWGFLWVKKKKHVISNPDNLKYFDALPDCEYATIICNHTSAADIFIMLGQGIPICFITNHQIKGYPFVGLIANIMQCIFVNRLEKDSREKCFDQMRERIELTKKFPNSKMRLTHYITMKLNLFNIFILYNFYVI